MSLQDNNDTLTRLEKTLKASEELIKRFQLPKSLEMMLNTQKKLEKIYGPSYAMREILKQQERVNKAVQIPSAAQKMLDQQQQIKRLFPKYLKTSSGLTFPKSIIGSPYSWHSLLATPDNISTLQSISKSIAKQHSNFPTTFFSNYGISTLLNIQRQISLLPTDIQTQFLNKAIQTVQQIDTTEEIRTEIKAYFDGVDTSAQNPEKRITISTVALILIMFFYNSFNDQLQMAIFEFETKPLLTKYLASKEVKSIVKGEIKKNELNTLYGKRITLSNLNLRKLPKQTATLLEVLEPGKILHTIDEPDLHKAWIKIEVDYNGEKTQGYVLRRYTTIIKP